MNKVKEIKAKRMIKLIDKNAFHKIIQRCRTQCNYKRSVIFHHDPYVLEHIRLIIRDMAIQYYGKDIYFNKRKIQFPGSKHALYFVSSINGVRGITVHNLYIAQKELTPKDIINDFEAAIFPVIKGMKTGQIHYI